MKLPLTAALLAVPVFACTPLASATASPSSAPALQSLDPAFFPDRLQFSWIENPRSTPTSAQVPRDYKESGSARLTNPGLRPLQVLDTTLEGPFRLVTPAADLARPILPGQFRDLTVEFVRDRYQPPSENTASGVFTGRLDVRTDAPENPLVTVTLAGFVLPPIKRTRVGREFGMVS
jgi:hypothetical protein